jgi:ATP-dependent Clp protease ATP-binding subunit ClpB
VIGGQLALDGEIVEDERQQGFKAPERPQIGFALAGSSGPGSSPAMVH